MSSNNSNNRKTSLDTVQQTEMVEGKPGSLSTLGNSVRGMESEAEIVSDSIAVEEAQV